MKPLIADTLSDRGRLIRRPLAHWLPVLNRQIHASLDLTAEARCTVANAVACCLSVYDASDKARVVIHRQLNAVSHLRDRDRGDGKSVMAAHAWVNIGRLLHLNGKSSGAVQVFASVWPKEGVDSIVLRKTSYPIGQAHMRECAAVYAYGTCRGLLKCGRYKEALAVTKDPRLAEANAALVFLLHELRLHAHLQVGMHSCFLQELREARATSVSATSEALQVYAAAMLVAIGEWRKAQELLRSLANTLQLASEHEQQELDHSYYRMVVSVVELSLRCREGGGWQEIDERITSLLEQALGRIMDDKGDVVLMRQLLAVAIRCMDARACCLIRGSAYQKEMDAYHAANRHLVDELYHAACHMLALDTTRRTKYDVEARVC